MFSFLFITFFFLVVLSACIQATSPIKQPLKTDQVSLASLKYPQNLSFPSIDAHYSFIFLFNIFPSTWLTIFSFFILCFQPIILTLYTSMETFAENPNSNRFPCLDMVLLFHSFTCYKSFKSFFSRYYWFSPKSHHENGCSKTLDCRNLGFDCSSKKEDGVRVYKKDVENLMGNLGIFRKQESEELIELSFGFDEVSRLFEEEEPSLDELKQAFDVFDVNKDGFIDAKELQRVLCVLGLKEGLKLENCKKMIENFDEDEDCRIDFQEFVKFMEIGFC